MKNLCILLLTIGIMTLGACQNYHSKQPVDSTYYKKTQSVAWPESTASAKPVQK